VSQAVHHKTSEHVVEYDVESAACADPAKARVAKLKMLPDFILI